MTTYTKQSKKSLLGGFLLDLPVRFLQCGSHFTAPRIPPAADTLAAFHVLYLQAVKTLPLPLGLANAYWSFGVGSDVTFLRSPDPS